MKQKLFSIKLEQHLIAGLLKFPEKFHDVSAFLQPSDLADPSNVNPTLYQIIGTMIVAGQSVDPVLVAQRVSSLGIKFEDGMSVFDYLQSLSMRPITESAVVDAAKGIKKLSVRRSIIQQCDRIASKMTTLSDETPFDQIVTEADAIFNNGLNLYFNQTSSPQNIFADMEAAIEARGENPVEEIGPMSPFPRLNEMCGSLFRGGNITVVVSRYGVGKSTLALDLCTKVGTQYKIPLLHFDNGEMSYQELQMRQCAAMSGVPLYLIESGKWRHNAETTKNVRAVWKKIKEMKFYYYNVGGMDSQDMINVARRWYYSNVGRGKPMLWSFDYIKLLSVQNAESFWAAIGLMLDAMKMFIQKEIVFDNKPMISLLTSVQANRLGISGGKKTDELDDSEAVVGLSDMIGQISSHLFILRKKTVDEVINEGVKYGTHKLKLLKARHMGKNPARMFDLVSLSNGAKANNFINLEFNNFSVEERGDLIDWVNATSIHGVQPQKDQPPNASNFV